MNDFPSLIDHILIWVFGIILPFLSGMQSDKIPDNIQFTAASRRRLYLGNSIVLTIAGSVILLVWVLLSRPWPQLGFKLPAFNSGISYLLMGMFAIGYAVDMFFSIRKGRQEVEATWIERSSFLPEAWKEVPVYMILCLCAGFFEEIIYRGFMVTYFKPETVGTFPVVSLFAPAILFSLAHYYQGWIAVTKILVFAILLNWIFIECNSLYPTMIIHFLVDLTSGLASMLSRKKSL